MKYLLWNKLYQKWDKIKSLFVATNLKLLKSQAIPVTLSNSFIEIFSFTPHYRQQHHILHSLYRSGSRNYEKEGGGGASLAKCGILHYYTSNV